MGNTLDELAAYLREKGLRDYDYADLMRKHSGGEVGWGGVGGGTGRGEARARLLAGRGSTLFEG